MFFKLIFAIFALLLSLYFVNFDPYASHLFRYFIIGPSTKVRLFTPEELKEYNGITKPELYLAVLGRIYNVTEGAKHYGPNQSYYTFVGRDASRNFITGEFTSLENADDVSGLREEDYTSLNNWRQFYKKNYQFVGKLIGRFYDEYGMQTEHLKIVKKLINKAEKTKHTNDELKLKFPPCNVEWDAKTGTKVWCTKKSGGITRDWVGLPRKLYEPGMESYRCACVKEQDLNSGNIKEYEGCDLNSAICNIYQNK